MTPLTAAQGLKYGAMGLPLAFVALPLYVLLPNHYATQFGVPLATLGLLLLAARLFDAFIDPLIGLWVDSLFERSAKHVLRLGAVAAVALAAGFIALFYPPTFVRGSTNGLLAWLFAALMVTYAAYSTASVAHQAWGARMGGSELFRSRVVAWREGLGLVGVVLASTLPVFAGMGASAAVFVFALLLGWWLWTAAPAPLTQTAAATAGKAEPKEQSLTRPLMQADFRRLLAVFVLNGIASAIPATLLLFFVQDRLQAAPGAEGPLLAAYFVCAAASIPLWLRVVARIGLARAWLIGMVLAIAVFVWAAQLGPGDLFAFGVVCALSGVALGTDLAFPSALLAGVIQRSGDAGQSEGAYFGWWNFATKLNLALAAGLALPLLGFAGYAPGIRDADALQALTLAYCVLPCLLKAAAALLLYFFVIKPETNRDSK